MTVVRTALLLGGVLAGAVGVSALISAGLDTVIAAAAWLVVGVLAHDALLAPLTIGLTVVGIAVLPRWGQAPAAAVVLVVGTLTLMAVPVLGRFGARADNPTLLDRPYVAGWLVLTGLVLTCAAAWAVALRRAGGD